MILKEAVALLLDGKGGYTCSDNIEEELFLYKGFTNLIQQSVDRAKEVKPDITHAELGKYLESSTGQIMLKAKECLESHGYDTSTLPHVIVPEFGDVASLALRMGMGAAIMGGLYVASRFKNKLNYKF